MTLVLMLVGAVALVVLLSPFAPSARAQTSTGESSIARAVQWRLGKAKRDAEQSARRAIEVATGLAAAVEAGLPPRSALPGVLADLEPGADADLLADVDAAARDGGDVAGVLLSSDREHWRAIGVAWRVGEESGARFAPVLDRVGESLRTDERIRREARVALATASATAKALAALPLLGVAIGRMVGSNTIAFLFTKPAGWGCLLAGFVFEGMGLLWTRSLMRRASS